MLLPGDTWESDRLRNRDVKEVKMLSKYIKREKQNQFPKRRRHNKHWMDVGESF